MATVLVKLRILKTPVSGRDRDLLRYIAAVPNLAGRPDAEGNPQPCFTGKYFVTQSSDIPVEELSPQYWNSFKDQCAFLGYDNLEITD